MADVKDIILEAGKTLGRSEVDLEPFIQKIIQDNWIDTKDALISLTSEQWRDMGVPIRLVDEIKRQTRLHLTPCLIKNESLETFEKLESSLQPTNLILDTPVKEVKDAISVEYGPPCQRLFPNNVSTSIQYLIQEQNDAPDLLIQTLITLLKIVDGVLNNPENPIKRRIRLDNPKFRERVGQFPKALECLKSFGFIIQETTVELPIAYISRLVDARHVLSSALKDFNINVTAPENNNSFNPYQATVSNASQTSILTQSNHFKKLYEARANEAAEIQTELPKVADMLKTGGITDLKIDENPKIFYLANISRVNQLNTPVFEDQLDRAHYSDNENEVTPEMLKSIRNNFNIASSFKSRAKEELEQLRRKKIFQKCILRIQFPDKLVLQLEFTPSTTLKAVHDAISRYLDSKLKGFLWYIYQTPPKRTFDSNKTVYEEGLVPGAMVYFKITSDSPPDVPYLSAEYIPAKPTPLPASKCAQKKPNKRR